MRRVSSFGWFTAEHRGVAPRAASGHAGDKRPEITANGDRLEPGPALVGRDFTRNIGMPTKTRLTLSRRQSQATALAGDFGETGISTRVSVRERPCLSGEGGPSAADQDGGACGGLYSPWTATPMSPPPNSTGSMYKRPSAIRSSRTTKIVTPRIANAEPSVW